MLRICKTVCVLPRSLEVGFGCLYLDGIVVDTLIWLPASAYMAWHFVRVADACQLPPPIWQGHVATFWRVNPRSLRPSSALHFANFLSISSGTRPNSAFWKAVRNGALGWLLRGGRAAFLYLLKSSFPCDLRPAFSSSSMAISLTLSKL